MKKLKSIIIILIAIIITIVITTISYAENENTDEEVKMAIEKSEEFTRWENLSEKERKNTIQPPYYNIQLKDSVIRSTLNNLLKDSASTIPSNYNLRTVLNNNIKVKDQKQVASCWAFSYSSIFETTMANKYKIGSLEYSPMHADYKTSQIFNRVVGDGGTYLLSLAYSASGYGPVDENDFKFEDVYHEQDNSYYLTDIENLNMDIEAKRLLKDATVFPSIYKSYSGGSVTYKDSNAFFGSTTYTDEEVETMRKMIKQHIIENGAVSTVLYTDEYGYVGQNGEYISNYYNNETNAYYCPSTIHSENHGVTIVGWDDEFNKENFNENYRPLHDGAYIVLNSWGSQFGDNGYFYVSYDDCNIEHNMYGINVIEEIDDDTEYKLYEYDPMGANYALYAVNDEHTKYLDSGYAANVYTRDNTQEEYLSEVGVFLLNAEGVEVYVNANNDNKNDCKLVATATGSEALEEGYHTIKISSPIKLTGSKFVVKVKYINSERTMIPVECNLKESGITDVNEFYINAKSNVGESFISMNGNNWSDLANYQVDDSITLKNTSACIKAITTTIIPEISTTGVELNRTNGIIEEGNTLTLTATVKPDDATNKNVTWSSSNEQVAIVENGVVTALKDGVATITVTTEDGNHTASCQITVTKKAEEAVSVIGVELNRTSRTIEEGNTLTLTATVKPDDATNKNVTWSSSNEQVATVENGIVIALKAGVTIITVATEDGNYTASCQITVTKKAEETVSVTGVELDKQKYSMQVGDTSNLVATIKPTNATHKNVTWSSSDENIISISDTGIIKAIKKGKATIIVTTEDGNHTDSCEITVTEKTNTDDDIYISKEDKPENDTTISPNKLPFTGKDIIIAIIVLGISIIIISFVRYNKMKDIK